MGAQGRGIEIRGSSSGEGSRLGGKVRGQGLEGTRSGVKVRVKVVVKVGGQGRVMIGGHKVGGQDRGQCQGIKVWGRCQGQGFGSGLGVGVRWSVGFSGGDWR